MPVEKFNLTLTKVIQETYDVKTFQFKPDKPVSFKAGQWLMLYLNTKNEKGGIKRDNRAYSIASSPTNTNLIDINFRVYSFGKFTPILYNLKEGNVVEARGPFGKFTYEPNEPKDLSFIAGGTGIAPIRGIIQYIKEAKLDVNMTLLFSCKTTEDIIFDNEFKELVKNKKFKYIPTITRINESKQKWDGETGRISKEIIKKYCNLKSLFYICGPPEMVDGSVKFLEELGVTKEKIKVEVYH
ncbi:MAG: FAD-dependent oxidoreductase [Candidatus Woesearchaeota archaeon]|nr:MAG: FAD-dependent oxidoreductase [Candidatus Woesearchaeota archaeon]